MITFKKKRNKGCKLFSRGTKRFKSFEGNHLSMSKGIGLVHITWTKGNIHRFLLSNVGRPIDKVFSEYLERCESSMYDAKKSFFSHIKKKENISNFGGFYVTNGILNYKKRKRRLNTKGSYYDTYLEFNKKNFPDNKTLSLACNKATRDGLTLLGKFYVFSYDAGIELKNVFIRDVSSLAGLSKFKTAEVLGTGRYLCKQQRTGDKGTYTSVEPSDISSIRTTSNHDVFEFIIKEKK